MNLVKDKGFYKTIISITIPIACQNLIGFGVNLTDTVMVGSLGELQLSAVSLANQVFFVFMVLTFGVASGASVLTAQYWGKNNTEAIRRVFAIAINFAVLFSLIFASAAFFFPQFLMGLLSEEAAVIQEGARYLRVVAFSYFFFGVTNTYLSTMRSVEEVKISVVVFGTSFFVNALVNYALIFGKLGFPAMGVVGAAIGTLCSRIVEFIILNIYIAFFEKKIGFRFPDLLRIDKLLLRDYFSYGLPVLVNELVWSSGMAVQAAIIGRIGSEFVAANSIVGVVNQLVSIFMFGAANASAVVVGKAVGTGDKAYVRACGNTLILISVGMGLVGGVAMFLLRGFAVNFYNVAEDTKRLAETLMMIMSINSVFIAVNCISIVGTLRGAGDTRFGFIADVAFMWTISIPLGILTGWFLRLPAWVVYLCLKMDEPLKAIICTLRVRGKKWIRDVTR